MAGNFPPGASAAGAPRDRTAARHAAHAAGTPLRLFVFSADEAQILGSVALTRIARGVRFEGGWRDTVLCSLLNPGWQPR